MIKTTFKDFLEAVQAGNNDSWVRDFASGKINELDKKKYLIRPIKTLNYNLIRYDHTFNCYGYEDEGSFGLFVPPLPYSGGVSILFSEWDTREICDFFGWDFDKVAIELKEVKW